MLVHCLSASALLSRCSGVLQVFLFSAKLIEVFVGRRDVPGRCLRIACGIAPLPFLGCSQLGKQHSLAEMPSAAAHNTYYGQTVTLMTTRGGHRAAEVARNIRVFSLWRKIVCFFVWTMLRALRGMREDGETSLHACLITSFLSAGPNTNNGDGPP